MRGEEGRERGGTGRETEGERDLCAQTHKRRENTDRDRGTAQLQDQLLAGMLQPREPEHALKEHWSRSPGCWFSSPGCCSPRVTWEEPLPFRSCRFPPCERHSCKTSVRMLSPPGRAVAVGQIPALPFPHPVPPAVAPAPSGQEGPKGWGRSQGACLQTLSVSASDHLSKSAS